MNKIVKSYLKGKTMRDICECKIGTQADSWMVPGADHPRRRTSGGCRGQRRNNRGRRIHLMTGSSRTYTTKMFTGSCNSIYTDRNV